jgi:hypothetical protein
MVVPIGVGTTAMSAGLHDSEPCARGFARRSANRAA